MSCSNGNLCSYHRLNPAASTTEPCGADIEPSNLAHDHTSKDFVFCPLCHRFLLLMYPTGLRRYALELQSHPYFQHGDSLQGFTLQSYRALTMAILYSQVDKRNSAGLYNDKSNVEHLERTDNICAWGKGPRFIGCLVNMGFEKNGTFAELHAQGVVIYNERVRNRARRWFQDQNKDWHCMR